MTGGAADEEGQIFQIQLEFYLNKSQHDSISKLLFVYFSSINQIHST